MPPFKTVSFVVPASLCIALLSACGADPSLPTEEGYGAKPTLPQPDAQFIPTVKIAEAIGWGAGQQPTAAPGMQVNALACQLDHPRWLHVLPNGDVLVAETNAPERPEDRKGIKGWFMSRAMRKAGAATPSANRITLLRDADGDGLAETREVFLRSLNSPFGMELVGSDFYVANADALMRFSYQEGATQVQSSGEKVADLPGGPINHHWTKNVIANPDGSKLYVTVGSNSNVGERGMQNEEQRAAILEINPTNGQTRVFASGLRNPNGMDWEPHTNMLWTVVNERDEIGNDLVPDYLTSVQEGGFYGWPYSYYGQHVDERITPPRPDLVAKAVVPDFALGSHTASLGLMFYTGSLFSDHFRGGAFIGQHGSWNREPPSGYKVVFVPFSNGKPAGAAEDVLKGFLSEDGKARGRPVGVAVDGRGALLVADDVGNCVWRVIPAS